MARAQEKIYKVLFKKAVREVTHSQLKKAPDSLISTFFLHGEHKTGEEFQLRYNDDGIPNHQAWPEGDADLFEVCMDCYTCAADRPPKARKLIPAATLKSSIVDFFKIPPKLWPQGLRVAMKAMEQRAQLHTLAEGLLDKCILMMEADMRKASVLIDNNLDAKYTFYFERATQAAGRPSANSGPQEQLEITDLICQ
ncbi:hypothetical protein WJX73_008564 [Symbiochloris irregularis]|uniref:Uncharacterized protein n=1 Tax=Symbiochloris irregularis TaxID=706552 RepID=A0AAW1NJ65_9CHLO